MDKEKKFFHDISKNLIDYVKNSLGSNKIAKHKEVFGDYATEIDIAVEDLIVKKLKELFPEDSILAEEGYSDTPISNGRIWVIDPICGTTNLGRGINAYCTNIALVIDKEIVASCVIDHSLGEYVWSVGEGVFIMDKKLHKSTGVTGRLIDIDQGAAMKLDDDDKKRHIKICQEMAKEKGWMLTSLNTSLSFMYIALGKIDGVLNIKNHPWDVFASVFLVRQMGGRATNFSGDEWGVDDRQLVMALDEDVHTRIIKAITIA